MGKRTKIKKKKKHKVKAARAVQGVLSVRELKGVRKDEKNREKDPSLFTVVASKRITK